ncbi:hypothetical protein AOQ84DRAFT_73859 [Glonium stellatum]|uniref:Uncharacterized protein n=1 Tax=Glonium stellatum TaxID=574774 RepID=A0A8E2JRB1_9PEZI|nr:hypothetical protein AOQ84DRAFT_73859 [Glonium stellatum]
MPIVNLAKCCKKHRFCFYASSLSMPCLPIGDKSWENFLVSLKKVYLLASQGKLALTGTRV